MQKEFLSDKNYFFEHSGAEYFLAVSDNKIVGRIASIRNNVHNRIYKERTGFFGLFESVDNYEVAELLFDKVKEMFRTVNNMLGDIVKVTPSSKMVGCLITKNITMIFLSGMDLQKKQIFTLIILVMRS